MTRAKTERPCTCGRPAGVCLEFMTRPHRRGEPTASAMERARELLDAWPNIGMECDEDALRDAIARALAEAERKGRVDAAKLAEEYAPHGARAIVLRLRALADEERGE